MLNYQRVGPNMSQAVTIRLDPSCGSSPTWRLISGSGLRGRPKNIHKGGLEIKARWRPEARIRYTQYTYIYIIYVYIIYIYIIYIYTLYIYTLYIYILYIYILYRHIKYHQIISNMWKCRKTRQKRHTCQKQGAFWGSQGLRYCCTRTVVYVCVS